MTKTDNKVKRLSLTILLHAAMDFGKVFTW